MPEFPCPPNAVAPSVKALLATFHADTAEKLQQAPSDSRPVLHRADGSWCEVGEDGWPISSGDTDQYNYRHPAALSCCGRTSYTLTSTPYTDLEERSNDC